MATNDPHHETVEESFIEIHEYEWCCPKPMKLELLQFKWVEHDVVYSEVWELEKRSVDDSKHHIKHDWQEDKNSGD